jgi:hypothetical protein
VFTPEDFSEEQKMMKDAVIEFNDREIFHINQGLKLKIMPSQKNVCVKLEN